MWRIPFWGAALHGSFIHAQILAAKHCFFDGWNPVCDCLTTMAAMATDHLLIGFQSRSQVADDSRSPSLLSLGISRMSLLEITLHFDSMYPISAYLYWFRANTMLNDDHKTQFSSWFDSQWSPCFVGQIPILFGNPYSSLLNSVAQAALRTLQGRPRAQPSSWPHSAATTSLSWVAGNAPATRRGVPGLMEVGIFPGGVRESNEKSLQDPKNWAITAWGSRNWTVPLEVCSQITRDTTKLMAD